MKIVACKVQSIYLLIDHPNILVPVKKWVIVMQYLCAKVLKLLLKDMSMDLSEPNIPLTKT